MTRQVEAEFLDELPPDNAGAVGSRRDLVLLNRLMLNSRTMAQALQASLAQNCAPSYPRYRRLLDLGAGDGRFMLNVARRLGPDWRGTRLTLLDRHEVLEPQTEYACAALEWQGETVKADVIEWLEQASSRPPDTSAVESFDAIVANLFLHHFVEPELLKILRAIGHWTDITIATEPRRSASALALSKMLPLIGCNHVTCHDAVSSVRAGFSGQELSRLWPVGDDWRLDEHAAGFCCHLFMAVRRKSPLPALRSRIEEEDEKEEEEDRNRSVTLTRNRGRGGSNP